jgi:Na+-transporting methylmalonyl-CoA/oxaloacetate decarboxylase gamma subunit
MMPSEMTRVTDGVTLRNEIPTEEGRVHREGIEEVVMRLRLALVLLVLSLLVSLLLGACATERSLKKKAAAPTGKEQAEGALEAIPEPISPKKKATSQTEAPSSYVEQEVPANVEESDIAPGYRVQIFASSSLEKAEEVAGKARSLFSERVYVEYSAPLYRVRAGNFTSKEDALRFREKAVQSGYEGAWVVEALVERK